MTRGHHHEHKREYDATAYGPSYKEVINEAFQAYLRADRAWKGVELPLEGFEAYDPAVQVAFDKRSEARLTWLRTLDRYGMIGYPGMDLNPCYQG